MNTLQRVLTVGVLSIAAALLQPDAHAQAGDAGYAFLKLGVSGRGVSLADAMTAHAAGVAATHYNPAGLLLPLPGDATVEGMFMHRAWIEDTRVEFLGAAVRLGERHAMGFALNSLTVPGVEIRSRPGPPDATFDARNLLLGGSYAYRASDAVQAGVTLKLLYQKILVDETTGFGVDAGVQVDPGLAGLSLGAAVANLGTGGTLRGESTRLPTLLRAGGAWHTPLEGISSEILGALDVVQNFQAGQTYLNVGAEMEYDRLLAVRAGYQAGETARGLSLGLGLAYSLVAVDYAFAPLTDDLGSTHTISLAVRF
jgi:hypothetical protein